MSKKHDLIKKIVQIDSELRLIIYNPETIEVYPLGRRQLHALTTLREVGVVNMTRLANEINVSNQQLTKLVDVLVKKKMVKRIYNEDNRREILLKITEAGEEYLANISESIQTYIKKLFVKGGKYSLKDFEDAVSKLEALLSNILAN